MSSSVEPNVVHLPAGMVPETRQQRVQRYVRRRQRERIERLVNCAKAASYPIRGIWFFLRNPEFYPLFWSRLLPLSLISLCVYGFLFTFAFLPQFAFLALFHGWAAWWSAVFLVLAEGLVIIQGLFEGFFVDECRVDVFDATLIKFGKVDLLESHRTLFSDAPTAVKMLGKPLTPAIYAPWSFKQILELIVCLPLNLIPYLGPILFLVITGTRLGKLSHYRWYKLRGLSRRDRKAEIKTRTPEYVAFGTVAMVLEFIPVFSFFFLLTTSAAAAMWASKLESIREIRNAHTTSDQPHEGQESLLPPPQGQSYATMNNSELPV